MPKKKKEEKDSRDTTPLWETVTPEEFQEKVEREWKIADLPPEDKINKKGNYNPESIKNLAQYNKRSSESKEKTLKQLRMQGKVKTKVEEKADKIIDKTKRDPKVNDILGLLPVDEIFDLHEKEMFEDRVELLLKDFNVEELSSGDVDDILSLAQMRVLEIRLLKACKNKPTNLLDASQTLEKLRKDMNKMKENLGSRRRDRVSLKDRHDVTILDLARLFDLEKRHELDEIEEQLLEQESDIGEEIKNKEYEGNKNDIDAHIDPEREDDL